MNGVLAALLVLSSSATGNVTVAGKAARLPVLLQALSEQTGREWLSSESLKDRVVYLQCESLPESEVEKLIADAVDGKWVQVPSGRQLVTDTEAFARRRQAFREGFAAKVNNEINKRREGAPIEFDNAAATSLREKFSDKHIRSVNEIFRSQTNGYETPIGRLALDLLADVDFREVAELRSGEAKLFATERHSTFERISVPAARLKRYDAEQVVWNLQDALGLERGGFFGSDWHGISNSELPAKSVYLSVTRQNDLPMLLASCVVIDQAGNEKCASNLTVFLEDLDVALALLVPSGLSGTTIQQSPRSQEYLSKVKFGNEYSGPLLPSDPLHAKFLDPENHEPFDFWIADVMRPLAEASRGNLVASLDDGLYGTVLQQFASGALTAELLERTLRQLCNCEVIRTEAHTVLRPADPGRPSRNTLPRVSLARLLRELDRNGFIELETVVTELSDSGGAYVSPPVVFEHVHALVPGYERALQSYQGALVRILSALTREERARLYAGQSLAIPDLTPQSRNRLNDLIKTFPDWGNRKLFSPGQFSGALGVPLLLPDGVTPDTSINAEVSATQGFAVFNPAFDEEMAWTQFGPSQAKSWTIGSLLKQGVQVKFWYGQATHSTFSVSVEGQTVSWFHVFALRTDIRRESDKVSDLPKALQDRIAQASGGG